jgi:hypothetical protein
MINDKNRPKATASGCSAKNDFILRPKIEEKVMQVGQEVVFVREVEGAEVGRHGTVIDISDDVVVVGCEMKEKVSPVLAQMWGVLPERLWNRLSKRQVKQRRSRLKVSN